MRNGQVFTSIGPSLHTGRPKGRAVKGVAPRKEQVRIIDPSLNFPHSTDAYD